MKSEPDCYSIDDQEKDGTNLWEGCRNYTVRNFFRDSMKIGDQAFFYHSSCEVPGIVGVIECVSDAYPDPTQFDPKSDYYDPKSTKENPRWLTRDMKFVKKLPRIVTLAELKETPGLESMAVVQRGQRLSVMPVTDAEWKIVSSLADRK
jgi:predicted RNA-binding protein with PUA-like domain